MSKSKNKRQKQNGGGGGAQNGGGGGAQNGGQGGGQNNGKVQQRTKNPANAQEAKKAIASDYETVLKSYIQNDLFPEFCLLRENVRLVLGVSGEDSLRKFVKSQEENYQDRTSATEVEIENKSEHGEVLKPKAQSVTKLQKYPKNVDLR